jgi:hypothetical protein
MSTLFGRKVSLVLSAPNQPPLVKAAFNDTPGVDVSGLDIDFSVRRSLVMAHPNVCDIHIYNLAPTTRTAISGTQNLNVSLAAGYQTNLEQIYLAEARAAWTERIGPDFVTHVEAGDGDKAMKARTNTGFGGRIPIATALQSIVKALGIGTGNINLIQSQLQKTGFSTVSASALTGKASRCLTDFCRSAGLEWSIQNGNLQIVELGTITRNEAVVCSVDTGMVESPTVDSHGLLSAKMLITPGLVPGGLVTVNSLFYNGTYRVNRCHWRGSVRGSDWHVQFEGTKY